MIHIPVRYFFKTFLHSSVLSVISQ
jgi:hypothetical protein